MLNELHHLWFTYGWPSLQGNGPEDGMRTLAAVVLASVFYPPFHRFIRREWERMHAKLDHIIEHHPNIPPFPKGRP